MLASRHAAWRFYLFTYLVFAQSALTGSPLIRTSSPRSKTHIANKITPSFVRADNRSTLDRQKIHYSARKTSHLKVPDCITDYKNCRKVAVKSGISENLRFHICHGLATADPLLTEVQPGYTVARTIDLARIHRTHCESCPPDHLYVRRMVTAAGKIPDNWKLSYLLAGHTDQELHAAQQGVATMYSTDQPGSGLVPGHTVYRKIPPFQSLADPAAAISATKYSHLHLNGLPASQSAAASPLGFISNKLIAFGQAEVLNSRHRGKSELQDELLQTIPSLQEVEYAKTGKAAKLKLPLPSWWLLHLQVREGCSCSLYI